MSINIQQYSENEAWLLFQLNEEPVRTERDSDFNVFCIMDVATGLLVGTEFLSARSEEPSELESRKLLGSSESKAGMGPKYLLIDADRNFGEIAKVATELGVKVIAESAENLDPITREARDAFSAHMRRLGQT